MSTVEKVALVLVAWFALSVAFGFLVGTIFGDRS